MSDAGVLRVTREGETITFHPDETVTVGRHPDSAVVILHSKVSRHHVAIRWSEGIWTVQDVGSSNGTFVGGDLVTELALTGPVKINIGAIDGPSLTLVPEVVDSQGAVAGEATVSIGTRAEAADRAGTRSLDRDVAQHFGRRRTVVRIGRAADNDLEINEEGVSWYHAELRIGGDGAALVDLNSRNGTFVNGKPIDRARLEELDLIAVGSHLFRFTGDTLEPIPVK